MDREATGSERLGNTDAEPPFAELQRRSSEILDGPAGPVSSFLEQ